LIDCAGIDAPGGADLDLAASVRDRRRPLLVFDGIRRLGAAVAGAHIPYLATAHVLHEKRFRVRIGHGIVRPRRELVQLAVAGPGVTGARLGDLCAEQWIRQYVDPRSGGSKRTADAKSETAAGAVEVAFQRRPAESIPAHATHPLGRTASASSCHFEFRDMMR
jgi:hypothetical protein